MTRSLRTAVVVCDPGGVTFLSGANVTLVPDRLAGILRRLSGPTRCRAGGLAFVAYETGRNGTVGCRGAIEEAGDWLVLADLEPFGASSGLEGFGRALGEALSRPGRFETVPRVARTPGSGTRAALLLDGMVEGGLAPGSGKAPEARGAGGR